MIALVEIGAQIVFNARNAIGGSDLQSVEAAITSETKMLWVETPTNPLLKVVDLEGVAGLGRKHGLLTVCDNTFASPYCQRPLDHGIDIVVHSATKYLNGHSDIVAGVIVTNRPELSDQLFYLQNAVGGVLGANDSFWVLRALKTLPLLKNKPKSEATPRK